MPAPQPVPASGDFDLRARAGRDLPRSSDRFDSGDDSLVILMPLYDDWAALGLLLDKVDAVLSAEGTIARVVVVDDASTTAPDESLNARDDWALRRVDVLHLRRNLGHQRAIAIGLAYIHEQIPCRAVVLMDSDGEDNPTDIPRLLERFEAERERKVVFAERARRSESWLFILFYTLFRVLHLVLTGARVRVGNFSVIPRARLASLVAVSELWNHYAAAVIQSRQPYCMVPTARAARLAGSSRMNFVRLVVHGLSAISVYSDVIGVRLIVAVVVSLLVTIGGVAGLLLARFVAHLAIPLWAPAGAALLVLILVQAVLLCSVFCLIILGGRQSASFLPCRDYSHYVDTIRALATASS